MNIFLKLVAFSITKKVGAYLIARLYGIPKLYRRCQELNRRVFCSQPAVRTKVTHGMRFAFRLPNKIADAVRKWWSPSPSVPPPPSPPPSPPSSSLTGGAAAPMSPPSPPSPPPPSSTQQYVARSSSPSAERVLPRWWVWQSPAPTSVPWTAPRVA
eukprot:EC790932.1.p2 GENE.EC790932.1~~EC790932.1.p2  ORF type:complete len:156 (+),score=21.15 EC790932.1:62-529(+)